MWELGSEVWNVRCASGQRMTHPSQSSNLHFGSKQKMFSGVVFYYSISYGLGFRVDFSVGGLSV